MATFSLWLWPVECVKRVKQNNIRYAGRGTEGLTTMTIPIEMFRLKKKGMVNS